MSTIKNIVAREILDSRGNPTVEVDLETESGIFRASVPSGASTGIYEAHELRDKDTSRFMGKGVLKAVDNIIKVIKPRIVGMDVSKQREIDRVMVEELDGMKTEYGFSKSKLGANAILAVSMAVCRGGAAFLNIPLYRYISLLKSDIEGKEPTNLQSKLILPVPAFNVINGGSHAGNKLAMQEFMILPVGASTYSEALRMGCEVYHTLKKVISEKYGLDATNVGDEGGFAPNISDHFEALELIVAAIKKAGYEGKVKIGMDVAASEFFKSKATYDLHFKSKPEKIVSGDELIKIYQDFITKYPMVSIEDPFDQDDFESYEKLNKAIGDKCQIVGDDLLVTNPIRIQKALDGKLCNALLLKINQIGTVSESIEACALARKNAWGVMVSHRSGETEDNFIADLVVGLGTGQIKTGAPCRSERLSKYNQLLRIESELGDKAVFAGEKFQNPSL